SPSDGAGTPAPHSNNNNNSNTYNNGAHDRASAGLTPASAGPDAAMADAQAPVQAYAKLEGPDFCYYVRSLEVSLGRHPSGSHTDAVDIDLGDSKAVSRRHARILYNFMSQSFELQVLGKNGCLVDDEYYARGQSVMLRHKMVIQIGDTEFAFLLPKAAMPADAPQPPPLQQQQQQHPHAHMPGMVADPAAPRAMMSADGIVQHPQPPSHHPPVAHAAYAVNAITPQRLTLYAPPDAARHPPSHLALSHRHPPAPLVFTDSPDADPPRAPPAHQQSPVHSRSRQHSPVSPAPLHSPQHPPYQPPAADAPAPPPSAAAAVPIRPASDKPVVDEYSVDPNSLAKPTYSYASLIAQAINATSDKKVTLSGIYSFIMQHYPYYRHVQNGWQNSIRHNLSLNKAFVRVQRASNEPGKGSYWAIEDSYKAQFSNGVYKRTRRTKKAMEMDRERQKERARARQESRVSKAAGSAKASADRPIAPTTARPRRTSAASRSGATAAATTARTQSPSTAGSSSMVGGKRMSPDDDDDDSDVDADRDDDEDVDVDDDDDDGDDEDVIMHDDGHHHMQSSHRSPSKPHSRSRPAKKRVSTGSNSKGGGSTLSTGEDT
ncbi:hypothetical protein LPJ75_003697, partial [Coemansia sp. RSA 2598]